MTKKLIVNQLPHETRVALLEDGNLVELFVDRRGNNDVAGNIYKGRVQRVLPGMQAAFVDIGQPQAAFIHVSDVIGAHYPVLERIAVEEVSGEVGDSDPAESETLEYDVPSGQRDYKIEELITEGQEMLVHVAKSPIGTKGARLTSYISLPGRFLVLMPHSDHIGISRRIEDEAERQRLRDLVGRLRQGNYGYIVRTAGEAINEAKITQEMQFLANLWETVLQKCKTAPTPSLVHKELDLTLRAVRDLLIHEAEALVVDSMAGYQSILTFLDTFMPSLKDSVELHTSTEPIFDAYNLEGDISRALKRKIWLKSGGYIVIEQTEALVAIDVNTGRYVGKHNVEETILKTNLEAVKEIAYQIRLRDIGGIIIIDFIDMQKKPNQERVFNALREALLKDRSKTYVLPMSEMGLIQMTRKRVRQSITSTLCEPCFYCDGEGFLVSRQTVCNNIYREIIREAADMLGNQLTLKVNPAIAELLHGEENALVDTLEKTIDKQIVVYPNSHFHLEEFEIYEVLTN